MESVPPIRGFFFRGLLLSNGHIQSHSHNHTSRAGRTSELLAYVFAISNYCICTIYALTTKSLSQQTVKLEGPALITLLSFHYKYADCLQIRVKYLECG
jgi:hypothetical protein